MLTHFLHEWIFAFQVVFGDVGHVQNRLGRQQTVTVNRFRFGFSQFQIAERRLGFQVSQTFVDRRDSQDRFLVARPSRLGGLSFCVTQRFQIRQHQLHLDNFNIRDRIDIAANVNHVIVFKTSHDLQDRIHLADMAEKFISQAFALAGSFDNARDIDQLQSGGNHLLRRDVFRDSLKPIIRHTDHAFVGLDRAKRIVRACGRLGTSQRVKKCTLAYVRQSDDSGFHVPRSL